MAPAFALPPGWPTAYFSGTPFRAIGYFVYHPTTVHKNLTDALFEKDLGPGTATVVGEITRFKDNPPGTWYADVIQTAADHCVVNGDTADIVRPLDPVNRAEMIMMFNNLERMDSCETK